MTALRSTEVTLPDGRVLRAGDEFAVVKLPCRFRFKWADENGDITCYGGPARNAQKWRIRSFRPEAVREIYPDRVMKDREEK